MCGRAMEVHNMGLSIPVGMDNTLAAENLMRRGIVEERWHEEHFCRLNVPVIPCLQNTYQIQRSRIHAILTAFISPPFWYSG
jgi:hypothetical protein